MSGSQAADQLLKQSLQQQQQQQNQQSLNRQLLFSMAPGDDCHRFALAEPRSIADQEAEAMVVKSPLKRKSDVADREVESGEWTLPRGYNEVFSGLPQTPVSGKGGKAQKTSRLAKSSKFGPQTPSNLGSPGNNLTPAGPCRYDSSLGLLTKKFINLIKQAEDGILDLNKAAGTLEAEVENLHNQEHSLDGQIRKMQERLRDLSEDENNNKWLFVTEEDIKSLPCFQNEMLIAIKAPHGTTLEVPNPDDDDDSHQRRYRIVLRSLMGPIDVYLVSQIEEKFEEIQGVGLPSNLPSTSGLDENPAARMVTEESRDVEPQGQYINGMCLDHHVSQDFVSGIMKIVPSDLDNDADYWLLSDPSVSITDIWRTESGIELNNFDTLQYTGMAAGSTTQPQTPPLNAAEVLPPGNSTGR
ncbi:transcription factor E2FB-like isoform X4 [Gossypium australe]|uniref:Transcription factor E2FB-like isoform X4 n=1 Tax=Gossypium australe TaxID=47621 RepID=A0A5B6WVA7_9ROSI|nr:transcription factor E2FB-like isoform X4 [Gossypium australe]